MHRPYAAPSLAYFGEIAALTSTTLTVSETAGATSNSFTEPDCPDYGIWYGPTASPMVLPGSEPWPGSAYECYVPY